MPHSQASQTHDENTCQTPLCNSGNPEGKSLKSQRIVKKKPHRKQLSTHQVNN